MTQDRSEVEAAVASPPPPVPVLVGPVRLTLEGLLDMGIFLAFIALFLVPVLMTGSPAHRHGPRDPRKTVLAFALMPAALLVTSFFRWLRWRQRDASWPAWIHVGFARELGLGAAAGVAALAVNFVFYGLALKYLHYWPKSAVTDQLVQAAPNLPAAFKFLLVASLAILSPFAEETYFRGMLLRSFRISGHQTAGVLISSALFALLHFETIGFVDKFAMGLLLAWLFLRTGSLTASIACHATNNGVAGLILIFQPYLPDVVRRSLGHS